VPSFVGFVPTPPQHIDAFFELAPVSVEDVVFDLGSGDGRLLFAAIERGAGRAVGVELDASRVSEAKEAIRAREADDRVTVLHADVMDVDLSEASVVLCYLVPKASADLRPKFEAELRPGTKVVMESFPVPGWKPERTVERQYKTFYLYTMPPAAQE
jgi:16S rRNA G966 N2-methylase RsmD